MFGKNVNGVSKASSILSQLTGKNVIGGQVDPDVVRFDFDGSIADYDTRTVSEHTGYPTEARGWSLFVRRPGTERD